MTIKDKIKNRQNANYKILEKITQAVKDNPHLRFGQILASLEIIEYDYNTYDESALIKDLFYDESVDILNRIP